MKVEHTPDPKKSRTKKASAPIGKKTATKTATKTKPVKRAAKKSVASVKKTPVKKRQTKPVTSAATSKKTKDTPVDTKGDEPVNSPEVVVLPTRLSIRIREKSLVYAQAFEERVERPAYALTMTLGALFILFGAGVGLHESQLTQFCMYDDCVANVSSATYQQSAVSASLQTSDTQTADFTVALSVSVLALGVLLILLATRLRAQRSKETS